MALTMFNVYTQGLAIYCRDEMVPPLKEPQFLFEKASNKEMDKAIVQAGDLSHNGNA